MAEVKFSEGATKIDTGEGEKVFPVDLLETIISMMPFPSIFAARGLSHSWKVRFEPIAKLNSAEEKLLAMSFQRKVAQRSVDWQIFCPIHVAEKNLIGYDQVAQKWRTLPPLLPEFTFPESVEIDGSIVYGICRMGPDEDINCSYTKGQYVANILTRESKALPPLPETCKTNVQCLKLVRNSFSDMYKMIISGEDGVREHNRLFGRTSLHIYDSMTETWSGEKSCSFSMDDNFQVCPDASAYLNGILYMVPLHTVRPFFPWNYLLAFNVDEVTLEEVALVESDEFQDWTAFDDFAVDDEHVRLVVFNAKLLMIVIEIESGPVHLLNIDIQSRRVRQLAVCEREDFKSDRMILEMPTSDNCIFYDASEFNGGLMLACKKGTTEWDFFSFSAPHDWSNVSCPPGLNPFMAV